MEMIEAGFIDQKAGIALGFNSILNDAKRLQFSHNKTRQVNIFTY